MYRFVRVGDLDDPLLREDFLSDREKGMVPLFKREKRYPERFDGMSAYGSREAAVRRWMRSREIAKERNQEMTIGAYVAEVELTPGEGFEIEDLEDPEGHLTIWGHPDRLATATRRIYNPEAPAE